MNPYYLRKYGTFIKCIIIVKTYHSQNDILYACMHNIH